LTGVSGGWVARGTMDSTATTTTMDSTATAVTTNTMEVDATAPTTWATMEELAAAPIDFLDDMASQMDASANFIEARPAFIEPLPMSRSASQHSLALSPPATPPRAAAAPATEPPALRQRRGFRVRTFWNCQQADRDSDTLNSGHLCAERAGSDTEETETEGEDEVLPSLRTYSLPTVMKMEAAAAAAAASGTLPIPTTPLTRQVACPLSPAPTAEETEEDTETEAEEESDAEETDGEGVDADLDTDVEEEAELPVQTLPPLEIRMPAWLFGTTLGVMVLYLCFVVYLLSAHCRVPLRPI
jgi:hypothetical protein